MTIDYPTSVRLFATACFLPIAILILFMKTGPDSRLNWFKNAYQTNNFIKIVCREDGSLKKYTKVSLFLFIVCIIIFAWIAPIKS